MQSVGFMIPLDKIAQLMVYSRLLTPKQKRDVLNYRANRWTAHKQQEFNQVDFLAVCFLRLVFQLLLIWSAKFSKVVVHRKWGCINHRLQKMMGGGATPQMGMYQSPPPFIVLGEKEWRKKKVNRKTRTATRKKTQPIQLNSHTRTNIVKFHKYILMSNQDLME